MHHVFSVCVCGYVLFTGRNGYMLLDLTFWGEITNPLISAAEIMEFRGMAKKYIIPTQLLFLISFITIRCTIASWHVFEIQVSDASFIFKACPTFIAFQSYEWTWMMLNKLGKLGNQVNFIQLATCSNRFRCLKKTN